jgi:uncharacterized protein YbbC (DUF1343 family)
MPNLRLAALACWLSAASACAQRPAAAPPPPPPPATVVPGIEVLLRDSLSLLRGKRVGLITNQSGRDRQGRSDIDLLYHAPGVKLVALFAPEHGIRGGAEAGATVLSDSDRTTGLPIYSLYGAVHAPTPEMLRNVDILLYDIQDAGVRFYTYISTMGLSANAAGAAHIPFVVLDRPDPLGGARVEGGVLDTAYRSFVGEYPVALRYGLTPGELLRYLVGTGQVNVQAHVIPMDGWRRAMRYDQTGLAWIAPSPNLRSIDALLVYPGTVFFEGTNLSEGRGTTTPFLTIGAGWLTDAAQVTADLNALHLPGVAFSAATDAVAAGQKWGGQTIPAVHISVTNRDSLTPVAVGAYMLQVIRRRHPSDFKWILPHMDQLAGSDALRLAVERGDVAGWLRDTGKQSRAFADATRRYWLYER